MKSIRCFTSFPTYCYERQVGQRPLQVVGVAERYMQTTGETMSEPGKL